jgi:hypothetical protein
MAASSPPSDPGDQQWQESQPRPGGDQMPAAPHQGLRPRPVEASFWLWIGYLALDAVLGGVAFLTVDPSVVPREGIAMLVVALLVDLAMLIFAFHLRAGRNWARIVLAAFGSLRLLFLLFALLAGAAGGLFAAILLLLVGAAMVTMFVPTANPWFRPRQSGP